MSSPCRAATGGSVNRKSKIKTLGRPSRLTMQFFASSLTSKAFSSEYVLRSSTITFVASSLQQK